MITNIEVREVHTIISCIRGHNKGIVGIGEKGRGLGKRRGEGGTGDAIESRQYLFDYVEPEGDEVDDLISHKNHPRLQDNLSSASCSMLCARGKVHQDWRV